MKTERDKIMLSKIALSVVVLGLCSHGCLAQTAKPSSVVAPSRTVPLDISSWLFPASSSISHPTLFPEWSTPVQTNSLLNMDWKLAELASKLSDIHAGMPIGIAVQRLRILGGVVDGGFQTLPATRYFFNPGITVIMPQKDGHVSGPIQIAPGSFTYD